MWLYRKQDAFDIFIREHPDGLICSGIRRGDFKLIQLSNYLQVILGKRLLRKKVKAWLTVDLSWGFSPLSFVRLFLLLPFLLSHSVTAISHPHTNDKESLEQEMEAVKEQLIVDADDCPDALCLL